MSEKALVVEEKERLDDEHKQLDKKVQGLGLDKIQSCSRTYVKKLEDTTKGSMTLGVNRK